MDGLPVLGVIHFRHFPFSALAGLKLVCISQCRISAPIAEQREPKEGCVCTLPVWEEGLHFSSGLLAVAG